MLFIASTTTTTKRQQLCDEREREKKLAKSIWWKFAFNNYDLIAINKTRFAVLSKFVDSFPWKVIVEIRELRASQPYRSYEELSMKFRVLNQFVISSTFLWVIIWYDLAFLRKPSHKLKHLQCSIYLIIFWFYGTEIKTNIDEMFISSNLTNESNTHTTFNPLITEHSQY